MREMFSSSRLLEMPSFLLVICCLGRALKCVRTYEVQITYVRRWQAPPFGQGSTTGLPVPVLHRCSPNLSVFLCCFQQQLYHDFRFSTSSLETMSGTGRRLCNLVNSPRLFFSHKSFIAAAQPGSTVRTVQTCHKPLCDTHSSPSTTSATLNDDDFDLPNP